MICPKCRTEQPEGFKYCPSCGFSFVVKKFSKKYLLISLSVGCTISLLLGFLLGSFFSINFKNIMLDSKINQLVNNPTEEYVIECLEKVPNIIEISAVTEDNDPNGNLNKDGGYTSQVYFSVSLVNQNTVSGTDLIDKGTEAGGSIEVYSTVKDAEVRNEYLSGWDNTILNSGSHSVIGTVVVRTSDKLTATQQKELETDIITVLTASDKNNLDFVQDVVFIKPTEETISLTDALFNKTDEIIKTTMSDAGLVVLKTTYDSHYGIYTIDILGKKGLWTEVNQQKDNPEYQKNWSSLRKTFADATITYQDMFKSISGLDVNIYINLTSDLDIDTILLTALNGFILYDYTAE
ncbi:MAG: hypothetical protein E7487_04275 [Ruminococcaceae bacterium]|nr:hypothetical protein [Oscillospiraceae bacterium]